MFKGVTLTLITQSHAAQLEFTHYAVSSGAAWQPWQILVLEDRLRDFLVLIVLTSS